MPIPWVPLPQMPIASPPPTADPTRPIATVSQTGIGSGPGTAQRARLPVMNPNSMIIKTEPSTALKSLCRGLRSGRNELAAKIFDLVAQLGGVLEAELLGGGEHLLLELDDQLLELRRRHAFDVLAAAPALRRRDSRRLQRQELGDVGHTLDDRLRRDSVFLVVRELDRPAT